MILTLVRKIKKHTLKELLPKGYSDLLSKGLDYKVAKKRLPLLDIIPLLPLLVGDATENILLTCMKNSFRVECLVF